MTPLFLPFTTSLDIPTLLTAGIPTAALALGLTGWAARRRAAGGTRAKRSGSPAVRVAALAALGCTVYSADTSWRFAADYLNIAGTAERAMMFGAAELGLFSTALMARQNLSTRGAPGVPGTLVWVITGVQVISAYAESGIVGGTVRAFVGPVMAAMLWHLAMGIEVRLRTPGATSHGLMATLGREARERLLSRLGIAVRDRDAAQITRDRATLRAVALAARLAERTPEQRTSRRGRRLTRRLSKAIGRAAVGTDPKQRDQLLDQLAARRHALTLATVPLPSPWSPSPRPGTPGPVPEVTWAGTVPPGDTVPGTVLSGHTVLGADPQGTVPDHGPRPRTVPDGDRSPHSATAGPVPGTGPTHRAFTVPADRDHHLGTGGIGAGTVDAELGTEVSAPGTEWSGSGENSGKETHEVPVQAAGDRGPSSTYPGTDTTGDRGPNPTNPGTDTIGDRGPNPTNPGTDTTGDRGPAATQAGKSSRRSGARRSSVRSRSASQGPAPEVQASVEELVQQVLPHVPALLQRDGNETVTRVQLREILRREGLTGGRNDRLSLVLSQLRGTPTVTTSARSVTR